MKTQLHLLGRWLDRQCGQVRHRHTGRPGRGSFLLREDAGLKKREREEKKPPVLRPNAGDVPVPFPRVRSGRTFPPLAHLKQMVTGRRGKEEGVAGGRFSRNQNRGKTESPSFDRRDVTLLSTTRHSGVAVSCGKHRVKAVVCRDRKESRCRERSGDKRQGPRARSRGHQPWFVRLFRA